MADGAFHGHLIPPCQVAVAGRTAGRVYICLKRNTMSALKGGNSWRFRNETRTMTTTLPVAQPREQVPEIPDGFIRHTGLAFCGRGHQV